jgi:predicted Rossmann-fold nucleotide-binding protein
VEATIVIPEFVDARVGPRGSLENLSQDEIDKLLDSSQGGLYALFRQCALAVLNSGADTDDAKEIFDRHRDFEIQIVRHAWGIKLQMHNAPASAFVDGEMIIGIKEHLFAVLRDIVYISNEIMASGRFDLNNPNGVTNAVFQILRHARLLEVKVSPNLVVCWGGHSIGRDEYEYTKKVGYEMGATIGHAKQRIPHGRYLGITEPGIIAAEPPNPIVSQLVIMPDIEKRLEAFVRLAHGIVVFPGGAGTAEEILYLAGILLDPANREQPFPVVLTGPRESKSYFEQIERFIGGTLGSAALRRFSVIIGDPAKVARHLKRGMEEVREFRKANSDSYNFNWLLSVPAEFQQPFVVTHESMRALELHRDQPVHKLAADLRRAFSGIVTGNVKENGIRSIEQHGPYELSGDPQIMALLDELLSAFVAQRRMKLPGTVYRPCYRLVA